MDWWPFPQKRRAVQKSVSRRTSQHGNEDLPQLHPNLTHQTIMGGWLTYPSEKYDFVSWDDFSHGKTKHVPNHQPDYQLISMIPPPEHMGTLETCKLWCKDHLYNLECIFFYLQYLRGSYTLNHSNLPNNKSTIKPMFLVRCSSTNPGS